MLFLTKKEANYEAMSKVRDWAEPKERRFS
jgi:hypothetical protein